MSLSFRLLPLALCRATVCKPVLAGLLLSLGLAASGAATAADPANAPPSAKCAALAGIKVEAGVVEGAERVAAEDTLVGGEMAGAKASANICRVRLHLRPVPGSDIKVEVWLPEDWNKKLFGIGGAGFDGGLSPGASALFNREAKQGYAVVATDVGHKPSPSVETWVHKQPEKVVDFGHRGTHLAAVVAKQVITSYYGDPANHAYFLGCSNGGREALMEASRYPGDYDGIIAGSPARHYLEVLTNLLWYYQIVHGPGGAPNLESKLSLVQNAIMKKCDELDGVKDGILENPLQCRFDPAKLKCKGADSPTCLNKAEVVAFQKIYGGVRLRNGHQVYSGPALGTLVGKDNWNGWVIPTRTALFGQDFYRWLVYDDPNWKFEDFDLDRDYSAGLARIAPIVNADADLNAFINHGGKLIMYAGWDDAGITPGDTIKYYEDVRRRIGPGTEDHIRLFMVPGMVHCAGGSGASSFEMQPVLENWVERGEAPERVVAEKPESGNPPFTHPLCAWPKTASYNGSGSTRDATSFTCKTPR